jgi:hypothetical protein
MSSKLLGPEELLTLLGWIPQEDWRRQMVSEIVASLGSAPGESTPRRWLRRPQTLLGRRTPLEIFRLAKRRDDPLLEELRRLAALASE